MDITNQYNSVQYNTSNGIIRNEMEKPFFNTVNDVVSEFYSDVRANVTPEGKYEPVKKEFSDPRDNSRYVLQVENYLPDKYPDRSCLTLGYLHDEGTRNYNLNLKVGTKQEILEFLGNQKNIDKIIFYMADLKERCGLIN